MPVWVKGNLASGVFLLNLHGGPGGSSMIATLVPAMQELEENYAVVYWDQRASGLSQGNALPATFTLDQFVEDTDLLVDAIELLYEPTAVFVFGHSWGGALGAAYLLDASRQAKITGYIDIDSGHNLEVGLPKSVIWLRDYAALQVADGVDTELWQEVFAWCAAVPDMTVPDNFFRYAGYIDRSNAAIRDPDSADSVAPDAAFILASPMSFAAFLNPGNLISQFNILELNLSAQMSNITIPSIVLWGRHDGINTDEMGQDAFDSLGTTPGDKSLVFFEQSGHQPFIEERAAFVSAVTGFVEEYR